MPLTVGSQILVREHAFLADAAVDHIFERAGGFGSMTVGSQGFFIDRFTGLPADGLLFSHAHHNAQEFTLGPGRVGIQSDYFSGEAGAVAALAVAGRLGGAAGLLGGAAMGGILGGD